MRPRRRQWSLALFMVAIIQPALLSGWVNSSSVTATQVVAPALQGITCPYDGDLVAAFGESLTCSRLTVLIEPNAADADKAHLVVARINGNPLGRSSIPLVMLLGGPGQEVESVLPSFLSSDGPSYRPLLDHRDVVLVDQRGVGYSTPSLACPFDIVGGVTTPATFLDLKNPGPGYSACAAELIGTGLNLDAFDSVHSAADVDLLRQALGVEKIDLLGISYGTRLALTVMRDFSASVRSAVLESPEPLQENLFAGQIIGFDLALSRIFSDCETQPACSLRYPDLEQTFAAAVTNLDASALSITATAAPSGEAAVFSVDGQTFLSTVYIATLLGSLVPFVPALIDGVRTGNHIVLENILPYTAGVSPGISLGASLVVTCNDEVGTASGEEIATLVREANVRPEIADGRFANVMGTIDFCQGIAVEPADERERAAVASDVPTLLIAGAYDPITPPTYAQVALQTLTRATAVTFANGSHAPLSESGGCGFGIVATFFDDPTARIDTACASETAVEFFIVPEG